MRLKTYSLDCTANGTGIFYFYKYEMILPNTEIITLIFITSCGQGLCLLSIHLF